MEDKKTEEENQAFLVGLVCKEQMAMSPDMTVLPFIKQMAWSNLETGTFISRLVRRNSRVL